MDPGYWLERLRFEHRDTNLYRQCQLIGEKVVCDVYFTGGQLDELGRLLRELNDYFLTLGATLSPQLIEILDNEVLFKYWLRSKFDVKKPYDDNARDGITRKLEEKGPQVAVRRRRNRVRGIWFATAH
jgi:hypothetical protein